MPCLLRGGGGGMESWVGVIIKPIGGWAASACQSGRATATRLSVVGSSIEPIEGVGGNAAPRGLRRQHANRSQAAAVPLMGGGSSSALVGRRVAAAPLLWGSFGFTPVGGWWAVVVHQLGAGSGSTPIGSGRRRRASQGVGGNAALVGGGGGSGMPVGGRAVGAPLLGGSSGVQVGVRAAAAPLSGVASASCQSGGRPATARLSGGQGIIEPVGVFCVGNLAT